MLLTCCAALSSPLRAVSATSLDCYWSMVSIGWDWLDSSGEGLHAMRDQGRVVYVTFSFANSKLAIYPLVCSLEMHITSKKSFHCSFVLPNVTRDGSSTFHGVSTRISFHDRLSIISTLATATSFRNHTGRKKHKHVETCFPAFQHAWNQLPSRTQPLQRPTYAKSMASAGPRPRK